MNGITILSHCLKLTGILLLISFSSSAASSADTIRIKTVVYCDHCMECESCWGLMENNLRFTKGVKSMSFDDKSMIITVVYQSGKTNPANLRKVITASGFDADDVKAEKNAVEKLDGCCRKRE